MVQRGTLSELLLLLPGCWLSDILSSTADACWGARRRPSGRSRAGRCRRSLHLDSPQGLASFLRAAISLMLGIVQAEAVDLFETNYMLEMQL